ncbi:hypothetical protein XELAEV_18044552mg [Xenopus laevis]|uniref:Uncharacterized protein n=1 Tax=Xenopus laevis TaxID=8355 RepID=A0A974H3W7_XENLA|nr:hypothetical protein XELAEV_18044552mg [Xenopus laevis]
MKGIQVSTDVSESEIAQSHTHTYIHTVQAAIALTLRSCTCRKLPGLCAGEWRCLTHVPQLCITGCLRNQ